jgi:hypothetical protein
LTVVDGGLVNGTGTWGRLRRGLGDWDNEFLGSLLLEGAGLGDWEKGIQSFCQHLFAEKGFGFSA